MSENNGTGQAQQYLDAGAFISAMLGFGNPLQDKVESFGLAPRKRLTSAELWDLYETDTFIANAIDKVPDAATQKYCTYTVNEEQTGSNAKVVQNELERVRPYINQAWKQARLQGWSAVLMYIDDGELDYRNPVNTRKIRGISGYKALCGGNTGEIGILEYDENPFSVTFGEPQLFTVYSAQKPVVHVSRLLLFYGVKKLSRIQNYGVSVGQLGTSIVDRFFQYFRNFDIGNNAIASTLPDFNVDIMKVADLATLLAKKQDFATYISGIAFARNIMKIMLVEAGKDGQNEGDYQIITRQYQGVVEILKYNKGLYAGSVDIPDTLLFNESPDGQTSGRYESNTWAQYVADMQERELRPELNKVIDYVHFTDGSIVPETWELKFPSILQLDQVDKADIDLKLYQGLQYLTTAQIATPEEAAKSLVDQTDVGDCIDLEAREEQNKQIMQFPEGYARVPQEPQIVTTEEQI